MAVLVYRKGNTHVVRGVECEMARIEVRSLQNHINQGWCVDPNDLVELSAEDLDAELSVKEKEREELKAKVVSFKQIDTNKSGKLSSNEVRAAAKKKGIEGYQTKRIKTLKVELGHAV